MLYYIYNGNTIWITRRKSSWRMTLHFRSGKFSLSAPWFTPIERIIEYIESSGNWINEQLAEYKKYTSKKIYHPPMPVKDVNALIHEATEKLSPFVRRWTEITKIYPSKVTIRAMKSRWGSARASGSISLNCFLIKLPDELIDSVIVHELCHLRIMDHSSEFYKLCCKFLPNYLELDDRVDNEGCKILREYTGYYE